MCENLISIAYIYGAYALAYIANIVLGIANNCLMHGDKFEILRILKSLLKLLVVAVVMACVVCGFCLLKVGSEAFGLSISETATDVISIASFLMLFANGFISVVKDVYSKIKEVFELGTENFFGESEDGIG